MGINITMPITVTKVDTFQAKFNSAFFNLTQSDPTTFPATTSVRIDGPDTSNAFVDSTFQAITAYYIFDQYALRTKAS
jgi:hypothetical protein